MTGIENQNAPKPNLIFISDLHLGAGRTNDFYFTYELHRLFDYAAENATELIILGDFLELLQNELTEIYLRHHPIFVHLFELAKKIQVSYVVGNHDAFVAADYRADAPHESYFLGSSVLVTPEYENRVLQLFAAHGHKYDLFNRRNDPLDLSVGSTPGDRITRAVGWLEKYFDRNIDTKLEKLYLDYKILLRQISHETKNYSALVTPAHPDYKKLGGDYSEYERAARDVLRSDRYTLCLFGHTHEQKIQHFEKARDGVSGIYVNTGSWVGSDAVRDPPTFVEVSAERIALVDAETFEVLADAERRSDSKFQLPIRKYQKILKI